MTDGTLQGAAESPEDAFSVWVRDAPAGPGQLSFTGVMLKKGPQVAKTASLSTFGDKDSGAVSKRELRFRRYQRLVGTGGFDFDNPIDNWAIENDEIDRFVAWLTAGSSESSNYRLLDTTTPQAQLLALLAEAEGGPSMLLKAVTEAGGPGELARLLGESPVGIAAAEAAVVRNRRVLVSHLQALAATPGTTETTMQNAMGEAYWLFGGRYVGLARRNLIPMDQHDFVLRTAGGTLHVIELKGPDIPRLVRKHRNHFIVGDDVHEAVSQAMNYLRGLDELGPGLATTYRNEYGEELDPRRVFATVVIGHGAHVRDATPVQVEQTLRTYNSHLARVQVLTYEQLLQVAERSLNFEAAAEGPAEQEAAGIWPAAGTGESVGDSAQPF